MPQIHLKLPALTRLTVVFFGCLLGSPLMISPASGQGWNEGRFPFRVSSRRENGQMMDLVKPLCADPGKSTVQILSDNRPVALGLIVHPSGLVVTKHSELAGEAIRVRLSDNRLADARVVATRREDDLALLRVDAEGLTAAELSAVEPEVGQFIVTVGRGGRPLHLGAISVASRRIEATGRLGIQLENNSEGLATVNLVLPDSGASEAGVRLGDEIVAIDDTPSSGSAQVVSFLRNFFPGEKIKLTIRRDGDTVELQAQIREFSVMLESENDSRLNGPRNSRLSGFSAVVQHDTVLDPDQCGGPIIDSQGRVIGLNIARAGRVVSYALPTSVAKPLVDAMIAEALAEPTNDAPSEETVTTTNSALTQDSPTQEISTGGSSPSP